MFHKLSENFYLTMLSNGWTVGRFRALDGMDSIVHIVATRQGFDVAAAAGDPGATAGELADVLDLGGVAYCKQVHGSKIVVVERGGLAADADGMITNAPSIGLMGLSADCLLIMVIDPVSGAVGMAHASWRGTVGRIAAQLVLHMASRFGSRVGDLVACLGPSAGPCCYEVGRDVLAAATATANIGPDAERFFRRRKGKLFFDLPAVNTHELLEAGLRSENVHAADVCTICRNDLFASYRKEGEEAGRFVAVIAHR